MLEDYNDIRFFSVSPPSLDRVPKPRTILFENNNRDELSAISDCVETGSTYTTLESNTENKTGSVTGSSTDVLELPSIAEKRHSLTRRDFVLSEIETLTRSTKTLDDYDLDVKLKVKPTYYQKWARNKKSRGSSDVSNIQPFSMVLLQQNQKDKEAAVQKTRPKRKKSTARRRVTFLRESSVTSTENESEDCNKKEKRQRSSKTRSSSESMKGIESVKSDKVATIDFKFEGQQNKQYLSVPMAVGLTDDRRPVKESPSIETPHGQKAHQLIPVIELIADIKPIPQGHTYTYIGDKSMDNGAASSDHKSDESVSCTPRAVTLELNGNTTERRVSTTIITAELPIGVSNQRPKLDYKNCVYSHELGLSEQYGCYPPRPIYNDLLRRREKQNPTQSSIVYQKTGMSTEVRLNLPEKENELYRNRMPVKISKSTPNYSGPNNLFVDFENLRIAAHLQKLEQYRNSSKGALSSSPRSKCCSVALPQQVIDRHGIKRVVFGYSVK